MGGTPRKKDCGQRVIENAAPSLTCRFSSAGVFLAGKTLKKPTVEQLRLEDNAGKAAVEQIVVAAPTVTCHKYFALSSPRMLSRSSRPRVVAVMHLLMLSRAFGGMAIQVETSLEQVQDAPAPQPEASPQTPAEPQ